MEALEVQLTRPWLEIIPSSSASTMSMTVDANKPLGDAICSSKDGQRHNEALGQDRQTHNAKVPSAQARRRNHAVDYLQSGA